MKKVFTFERANQGSFQIHNLLEVPPSWEEFKGSRQSAVLCLVVEEPDFSGIFHLLLTKRSTTVRTHKGQIGFPGGHREEQDKDPVATALRETHEEIGLHPEKIEILGSLPPILSLGGKTVVPIVGFSQVELEYLNLSEAEVAEAILAPLPLFDRGQEKSLSFKIFGKTRQSTIYRHRHHIIWGLTANMIKSASFETKEPDET